MLRYDAVIFDLDGTLTNSEKGITTCAAYALQKMGKPVPDLQGLRNRIYKNRFVYRYVSG